MMVAIPGLPGIPSAPCAGIRVRVPVLPFSSACPEEVT
jgi:hypothetical protein